MKQLLFLFLFTISQICFGQLYEFQMSSVKYRENKGNYFTEWSYNERTSVIVTLKIDESKIFVNTNPQTTYRILEKKPSQEIDDSIVVDYYCVDSKGKKCTITIVMSKIENITMVNLRYSNWEYIYTGYLL